MQVKTANLLNGPMRYLESGSGRAVVFLHAFPLSADQWLPQMHRVPNGWRFVAPDLRGFRGGAAPMPRVPAVSMDEHAFDVLSLMAHLEIDRAVIAGLSMGGYVAFAMARQSPRRIAGLVLANTRATADSPDAAAGRDRMIALVKREGPAAIACEMVPKLLGASSRSQQPDLEEAVRHLIEANTADGIAAALAALKARPDSSSQLAAIACPALIVAGEEDALIPDADAAAMQHGIQSAARVTIPNAGHLTNLEAPAAFNDILSGFLSTLPAAEPAA